MTSSISAKKLKFQIHKLVPLDECGPVTDKTVSISRVSKVVKGGRRFSFSALVVVGDSLGHVGYGLGKAAEVPDAIKKASDQAKRSMIKVPLKGTTIPHDITGKFGPSKVLLIPAAPGTGIIAGSIVRSIVELAGIKDIRTKCIGSSNPNNVLAATINALVNLLDPDFVAASRNIDLDQIGYSAY
jgi:small subunit ribosomal protein S5